MYIANAGSMPQQLAESTAAKGCEFLFSIPPVFEEAKSDNFVTIYVIASEDAEVTVEVTSQYFSKKKAKANEMLVFEIDASFGQVMEWTLKTNKKTVPASRIYPDRAIQINATKPVLCYVVCQYKWTSDGFVALPTYYLGNRYIVSTYSDMGSYYNAYFPSEVTITAVEDDTDVRFVLGGNAATAVKYADSIYYSGDTLKATLDKSDVWLIMSDGELSGYPDLSGSAVLSGKPVAVNSGNVCANIPVKNTTCDYIVSMDFPVNYWGKVYFVPPIASRKYSQIVRIYAQQDSTIVYKNDMPVDTLFAGGVENIGWIEMRMNGMNAPQAAVISANKPIQVSFYFPGSREDDIVSGDPFMLPILPIDMYQNNIVFCTPRSSKANSFNLNYINLVCPLDGDSLDISQFSIDCYGEANVLNSEQGNELKVIDKGIFQYNGISKKFGYYTIQLPVSGTYHIAAQTNFACYPFGFAEFASYAFPAFSLAYFNRGIDIEPPVAVADVACDGSVISGKIKDMPDNAEQRSNLYSVALLESESQNVKLTVSPFVQGISSETNWEMNTVDVRYDAIAAIQLVDKAYNIDTVRYKYYGLKGISMEPVRDNICIEGNMRDTVVFNLHNPKDTAFTLKLATYPKSNSLKLKSDSIITLLPYETHKVVFETGVDTANNEKFLIIEKCHTADTIMLPLEYTITHYPLCMSGKMDRAGYSIGDSGIYLLKFIHNSYNEDLKKITEMTIKFDYNNIFTYLDTASIHLPELDNWTIVYKQIEENFDDHISTFTMKIANPNGLYFADTNSILHARFLFLLPVNLENSFVPQSNAYHFSIEPQIATNYFPCATFSSQEIAKINIEKICGDELRFIQISPYHFDIAADGNSIINNEVKYSLGFDCNVKISIFNSLGEEVAIPVDGNKTKGNYSFNFAGYNLSSGIYFCELRTLTFHKIISFFKY